MRFINRIPGVFSRVQQGFTLVELLIVIAVIGVLATIVIVAVNPVQQLARGRDAGRISAVASLGRALQAYSVSRGDGTFPTENATWVTELFNKGEVANATVGVTPVAANCTNSVQNGVCYDLTGTTATIWTVLEADANKNRANCTATQEAIIIWRSSIGRAGIACLATPTTAVTDSSPADSAIF